MGLSEQIAREQRGLEIAAKAKLQRDGNRWFVPSQTGNPREYYYTVKPDVSKPHCTCPDFELRQQRCKHKLGHVFRQRSDCSENECGWSTEKYRYRQRLIETLGSSDSCGVTCIRAALTAMDVRSPL